METHFPKIWVGTDLEDAGLDRLRPKHGTYGNYAFDLLPPLPLTLTGQFDWLTQQKAHEEWPIGEPGDTTVEGSLDQLLTTEPNLPPDFATFMRSALLKSRIRSATGCYLDLCPVAIALPSGGRVVRFLADQQGCCYWYLYLEGGEEHAIVVSPDLWGTKEEIWEESDPCDPNRIAFCERNFETFMARFWIETEIWYAFNAEKAKDRADLPTVARVYLNSYLARQSSS